MSLTLTTDAKGVKIYRNERETKSGGKFTTYCMSISSKNKQTDEWATGYVDCAFRKGVELNNKAVIKISNAFPTATKYNGKTYVKWFIMEFEVVDPGEETPSADGSDFMNIPSDIDDEVPFL